MKPFCNLDEFTSTSDERTYNIVDWHAIHLATDKCRSARIIELLR
jgi:hypothetical protein